MYLTSNNLTPKIDIIFWKAVASWRQILVTAMEWIRSLSKRKVIFDPSHRILLLFDRGGVGYWLLIPRVNYLAFSGHRKGSELSIKTLRKVFFIKCGGLWQCKRVRRWIDEPYWSRSTHFTIFADKINLLILLLVLSWLLFVVCCIGTNS